MQPFSPNIISSSPVHNGVLYCDCDSRAIKRTSHTLTNPGRDFWNCPGNLCNFFKWADDPALKAMGLEAATPSDSSLPSSQQLSSTQPSQQYVPETPRSKSGSEPHVPSTPTPSTPTPLRRYQLSPEEKIKRDQVILAAMANGPGHDPKPPRAPPTPPPSGSDAAKRKRKDYCDRYFPSQNANTSSRPIKEEELEDSTLESPPKRRRLTPPPTFDAPLVSTSQSQPPSPHELLPSILANNSTRDKGKARELDSHKLNGLSNQDNPFWDGGHPSSSSSLVSPSRTACSNYQGQAKEFLKTVELLSVKAPIFVRGFSREVEDLRKACADKDSRIAALEEDNERLMLQVSSLKTQLSLLMDDDAH